MALNTGVSIKRTGAIDNLQVKTSRVPYNNIQYIYRQLTVCAPKYNYIQLPLPIKKDVF